MSTDSNSSSSSSNNNNSSVVDSDVEALTAALSAMQNEMHAKEEHFEREKAEMIAALKQGEVARQQMHIQMAAKETARKGAEI